MGDNGQIGLPYVVIKGGRVAPSVIVKMPVGWTPRTRNLRESYLCRVLGNPPHMLGCACQQCLEDRAEFGAAGVLGEVLAEVLRRRGKL